MDSQESEIMDYPSLGLKWKGMRWIFSAWVTNRRLSNGPPNFGYKCEDKHGLPKIGLWRENNSVGYKREDKQWTPQDWVMEGI